MWSWSSTSGLFRSESRKPDVRTIISYLEGEQPRYRQLRASPPSGVLAEPIRSLRNFKYGGNSEYTRPQLSYSNQLSSVTFSQGFYFKRQQLIQLCKRNGIKATGKNTEIIEKLKAHALNNPFSPSSLNEHTGLSSDDDNNKENRRMPMPRPSETWSVIEEDSREVQRVHLGLKDIQEEVEHDMNTTGSLRGFGVSSREFGNGTTSSKGSSVAMSIKAFASSFKRAGSKMSTATAAGVSASAHMEHAPFSDMGPPISTPVRPELQRGTPLPSPATMDGDDSRDISICDFGGSTIRLVTNNTNMMSPPALRPFTPTFQASFSPGTPAGLSRYPTTPFNDEERCDPLPPGAFPETVLDTPTLKMPALPQLRSSPAPPPFVFGSPANRISKDQFTSAAAAVLAEMNARLGLTGTDSEVGIDLLETRRTATQDSALAGQDKPRSEITNKFDKAHEREFQKMEGLGEYYARRAAASPDKGAGPSKKRKSDALAGTHEKVVRASNAHRRTSRAAAVAARRSIAPESDDADERQTKRVRISSVEGGDKRPETPDLQKTKPTEMDADEDEDQQTVEERERERAAIKKRLEVSRARRRSSMGRVSVGTGKPPLIPNQPKKGMATRFGFLSSAKSLVKSVWNRGATTVPQVDKSKPTAHVSKPIAPTKAPPNVLTKPNPAAKAVAPKAPLGKTAASKPDPNLSLRVPSPGLGLGSKSSTKIGTVGTKSSRASTNTSRLSSVSSSASARRAPIPSFSHLPGRISRMSSIATGGSTGTSGTKSSASGTGGSRLTAASSIGVRKPGKPSMGSVRSSDVGSVSGSSMARKRTSTLFAPTASSLARMQSTIKPPPFTATAASHLSAINPPSQVIQSSQVPAAGFTFTSPPRVGGSTATTATPNRIFSNGTPLFAPSAAQVPTADAPAITSPKPRPLPARRPRISRSRVIARVGAHRAASGGEASVLSRTASGRRSLNAPKARGSLGVRASGIGAKHGRDSAGMSARRRLRQSEVLRRRSKISGVSPAMVEDGDVTTEEGDSHESEEAAGIDVSMRD
ncbi:hypothetical protein BU17DRAFT_85653 [Hysterangium stoloniferum]|nr:hypothetical protein BU17DRAFT_85653 [Hysterangium stoloniferum]